jgi:hypothetical protein
MALFGETLPNIPSRTFSIPSPSVGGASRTTPTSRSVRRAARCGRPHECPAQPSISQIRRLCPRSAPSGLTPGVATAATSSKRCFTPPSKYPS